MVTVNERHYQRRRTAAQWTTENPTLAAAEIGYETDTGGFKIGDGATAWTALPYPPAEKLSVVPTGSLPETTVQTTFESVAGIRHLDIRNYGATTADALDGIQAALDDAAFGHALGYTSVVYVPPGTWQLDGKINIPDNTTLRGAGFASIIKGASGADFDVMGQGNNGMFVTIENIVIEDLTIDGNIYNQPHSDFRHGIVFATETIMRNLRMRNLVIQNCSHYGIGLQGNDFVAENVYIENVYIYNVGGDAFDCKGQVTRNCFISDFAAHYWGILNAEGAGVIQAALDLRGTWVVNGVHLRSLGNDLMAGGENHGIRLRPIAVRGGSIGNVVRGVTVAATGSPIGNAVFTHAGAVNQAAPAGNSVETINYARPNVIEITQNFNATDLSVYTTASITPEPLVLYLLTVANNAVDGSAYTTNHPTVTGFGLTWTEVASSPTGAGTNGMALFRAMGFPHTLPTDGVVTMTFPEPKPTVRGGSTLLRTCPCCPPRTPSSKPSTAPRSPLPPIRSRSLLSTTPRTASTRRG